MDVPMKSESTYKQRGSRKPPSSAWKKGESGNPGGRPRVAGEVRELARQHGHAAINRLVHLMYSNNESVAVRAAEALLDRGYCRPFHGPELNNADAPRQRLEVVLVPTPKRVSTAPPNDSLPPNGPAALTHTSSHPSAGGIISLKENGEITFSSQPVSYETGRAW